MPHSRDKEVSGGTASGLYKGEKVGSGPVGGSNSRPGQHSSNTSSSNNHYGYSDRGPSRGTGSNLLLLFGLFSVFKRLSPKTRKVVLTVIAIVAILATLRSFSSGVIPTTPSDNGSSGNQSGYQGGGYTGGNQSGSQGDPGFVNVNAREKRYTARANDTVTVMIYMCGTDLESKYGMATSDLVEMTKATIGDNVNVIVETGGCSKWKNNIVSSNTNQIYKVVSGGLETVNGNLGSKSMVKPETLTEFVKFCQKNYPAQRNILIFWDHGGGSITGYGYDEKNGGHGDSMTLDEINSALKNAGCTFDWIGFDACLMATYETATVCNNYADYLIASEESEPGTGWYYTNWLTSLSKNTAIDTVELSRIIIDDFINTSLQAQRNAEVTLSCIDLAELQGVYNTFNAWSEATNSLITSSNYSTVSNARAGARQFASSSRINQVDLIDLADRMGSTESKTLASALRSAVKYNKSSISKAYGVSIYFPYETMSSMSSASNVLNAIGFDASYTKCIKSFASLASGGQIASSGSHGYSYGSTGSDVSSLLEGLLGSSSGSSYSSGYSDYNTGSLLGSLLGGYSNSSGYASSGYSVSANDIMSLLSSFGGRSIAGNDWLDAKLVAENAKYISQNYLDPGDIFVQKKGNHRVVAFTDEQWNLIQTVELNVFVDDGEGFIDLGRDNTFKIDGNDLIVDYDNTWLTVNSQIVAYYMISDVENEDGSWTTTGRIPAILTRTSRLSNGVTETTEDYVDLIVVFDSTHRSGIITGATVAYPDGNGTAAKGTMELLVGDTLQFLCDYYTYDGEYSATYTLGSPMTVTSDGLKLSNMRLGNVKCSVTYRLTDIYNNYYWTPAYTTG